MTTFDILITNMRTPEVVDLGLIDYNSAWEYQKQVHARMLEQRGTFPPCLIICEHPHVYTLGKNGKPGNMLVNKDFLKSIQAEFVQTDRGGDITYHGPGQIVGYPIVDLNGTGFGIREYIHRIEESIICTLKEYNIESHRISGATGVWLGGDGKPDRKICAIGVRVDRWITMHGFAFNIDTELKYFNFINPCGFTDKGVTSLSQELGFSPGIENVKKKLIINVSQQLNPTQRP